MVVGIRGYLLQIWDQNVEIQDGGSKMQIYKGDKYLGVFKIADCNVSPVLKIQDASNFENSECKKFDFKFTIRN